MKEKRHAKLFLPTFFCKLWHLVKVIENVFVKSHSMSSQSKIYTPFHYHGGRGLKDKLMI